MRKTPLVTFEFEHETVLGDLLDLMVCYNAIIEKIHYPGRGSELWELTMSFPSETALSRFTDELGRNPIMRSF